MNSLDNGIPFVHLIQSRYGHYFYDVNTNRIVKVTEKTYKYLKDVLNGITNLSNIVECDIGIEIKGLLSNGYLSTQRPETIEMYGMDTLNYYLNKKLRYLVLQVTQKCNFHCRYCHFSDCESGYHTNGLGSMDWSTARKAIDFFAERTRDSQDISVVFYGGEPLIEKELVYHCIEYCNSVFTGKKITYYLTTNAALMDASCAKYLVDNNASVCVSLDGPQEIHDRNRKFASDGRGTYDNVLQNIYDINQKYPEYLKKISFNCVIDPAIDCRPINQFFSESLFDETEVKANLMSPRDGKRLYFSNDFLRTDKINKLLFMLTRANLIDESVIPILSRSYFRDFSDFETHFNQFGNLPVKTCHSGPCKPGYNKLFVSITGKFYICEKARDTSDALCIGSLESGFDIPKIISICNFMCRDKCKNCWNIRYCNVCQMMVDDGKKLSVDMFDRSCQNARIKVDEYLKELVALSEMRELLNR